MTDRNDNNIDKLDNNTQLSSEGMSAQQSQQSQKQDYVPTAEDIPFILEQLLISHQKMCEMMEESRKREEEKQLRENEQKTNIEKFIQYQAKRDEEVKGKEAILRGEIKHRKYTDYYDRHFTISVTTASDPNDFDSSSYQAATIHDELERYSDIINVINDGLDTLYAIVSHGGKTNFSKEEPIYPGEVKQYYHVYELRFRSPTAITYRVTEYDVDTNSSNIAGITDATNVAININTSGNNTIIAAPTNGTKIKILKLLFVCSAAVSVTLKSGGTDLTGAMAFAANGGMGFDGDYTPLGMIANQAFVINLGGNVQVSGFALYITEA